MNLINFINLSSYYQFLCSRSSSFVINMKWYCKSYIFSLCFMRVAYNHINLIHLSSYYELCLSNFHTSYKWITVVDSFVINMK